jgi:hypothetical protein
MSDIFKSVVVVLLFMRSDFEKRKVNFHYVSGRNTKQAYSMSLAHENCRPVVMTLTIVLAFDEVTNVVLFGKEFQLACIG